MLPRVLTHDQVEDTLNLFRQTLASVPGTGEVRQPLRVDGSALESFDSSALAVLLECRRMAHAQGRSFAVQALPDKLTSLAGLYGIDSLLDDAAPVPTAAA